MRPTSLSETVFLEIVLCLALTYSVKSQGLCQNFYFVLNNHVVDGHALEGHVVQRRTVNTAAQCHVMCKDNCQCVSFNYLPSDQENNCELNDANKEMKPDALKVKSRAQYYGLVRSYIMEVNWTSFRAFIWQAVPFEKSEKQSKLSLTATCQSLHWLLLKPVYNGHFPFSLTWPLWLGSTVSKHCI